MVDPTTVIPRRSIYFDTTFFDWVNARIDTRAIARHRETWNHLWYHEVDQAAMPRNWIREVVPFAQLAWRVGSGNPRDAQHAAYLFDTDLFTTANKRYAMTLELVRRWTKTPFADVARIDVPTLGSASIVERIERVLAP